MCSCLRVIATKIDSVSSRGPNAIHFLLGFLLGTVDGYSRARRISSCLDEWHMWSRAWAAVAGNERGVVRSCGSRGVRREQTEREYELDNERRLGETFRKLLKSLARDHLVAIGIVAQQEGDGASCRLDLAGLVDKRQCPKYVVCT